MKNEYKYLNKTKTKKNKYKLILILSAILLTCFLLSFVSNESLDYCDSEDSLKLHSLNINEKLVENANIITTNTNSKDKVYVVCQNITVKKGDSLALILKKQGISANELSQLLSTRAEAKRLKKITPGESICIARNNNGKLSKLEYKIDKNKTLHIKREQDSLKSYIEEHEFEKKLAFRHATINNSLFYDAKKADIPISLIMSLANIFSWDIDFAQDLRAGDKLFLVYEEEYLDGEKISDGPITAAEFINNNKKYTAIRYTAHDGTSSYFTEDGLNLKKAFIRTPVKFTRISSHFNLKRKHPILHTIRAHKGVDYAAPKGTPVKASGNGKVIFKGVKSGYGNVIILQHGKKYTTLYAHLSKFNNKLRVGSKVKQGDTIAYVGMSGLATAPHLHYEFRVNGVHKNPVTVKLPKAEPIKKSNLKEFKEQTADLFEIIKHHKKLMEHNINHEHA